MHANGRMVALDDVLQPVARLDSQGLANLAWNGCLSLACNRGMQHNISLPMNKLLTYLIFPYLLSNCNIDHDVQSSERAIEPAPRWRYLGSAKWPIGIFLP